MRQLPPIRTLRSMARASLPKPDMEHSPTDILFSVVIVAYKSEVITLDCIRSIYRFNDIGSKLEVILVDNSPAHNVHDAVRKHFPETVCIKNVNNGFGGGNNVGAATAKGKYLLFLNPDTILIEPIFRFAIDRFENNSALAMFGVRMLSKELKKNTSFYLLQGGGIIRNFFEKLCNSIDLYIDGLMYVSGANIFIRTHDFVNIGGFDENIFMYYEEPDLTRRLHVNKRKTNYFKQKGIIHLEGGTSHDNKIALRRRLDSAIYYNEKYHQNPVRQFKREHRLLKIKLVICKITQQSKCPDILMHIGILKEYITKAN